MQKNIVETFCRKTLIKAFVSHTCGKVLLNFDCWMILNTYSVNGLKRVVCWECSVLANVTAAHLLYGVSVLQGQADSMEYSGVGQTAWSTVE